MAVVALNFMLVFGLLLKVNRPTPQGPMVVERVVPQQQAPEIEAKPEVKPEPEPEEEPLDLPKDGVTVPSCKTYLLTNKGDLRQFGYLKPSYFNCTVLKEIEHRNKKYYLIKIREEGFQSDLHIVDEKGVMIITKE